MRIKSSTSIFFALLLITIAGLTLRLFNSYAPLSNYPFALSWSEAGRIDNAYQISNLSTGNAFNSFPWLDPARALMDSLVFLLSAVTIFKWRVWIVSISLITSAITAFVIVKRSHNVQKLDTPSQKVFLCLLTIFGILFFLQGPIYAHLLICVIPIVLFYKQDRPKVTLILITICSIWSGLTRVNWFLMPVIIATLLYVLSQPRRQIPIWRYLRWPFIWGLSNFSFSLATYFWALNKAKQPSVLSPALDYGFITTKLWPNDGYSFGLIAGIFLVTAPLLFIIGHYLWQHRYKMDKFRVAFILLLLSVLAAGSTLVSLRSGGGYDLHNYDTLILVVFILGIRMGLEDVQTDGEDSPSRPILLDPATLGILLIIPLFFSVLAIHPMPAYDESAAQDAIENVNLALTENASKENSQVLFIDHRTLVIFGQVPPQPIYAPYEKIELMEMAMAQNEDYFKQFEQDLSDHKFDVLITPLLWEWQYRAGEDPYWYENNTWAQYVVAPILKYYQSVYTNREADLAIYYPK